MSTMTYKITIDIRLLADKRYEINTRVVKVNGEQEWGLDHCSSSVTSPGETLATVLKVLPEIAKSRLREALK